jgi:ATP-dependent phosphoenolpyruvate carboxykinase
VLIRPTKKELEEFGTPDFTIYNAGQFPANRFTAGMTSSTSVEVNFARKEMVILGMLPLPLSPIAVILTLMTVKVPSTPER